MLPYVFGPYHSSVSREYNKRIGVVQGPLSVMPSAIIMFYHGPEQDILGSEACDGESLGTSKNQQVGLPLGCTACALGCRYMRQAEPVQFLAVKVLLPSLFPTASSGTCWSCTP